MAHTVYRLSCVDLANDCNTLIGLAGSAQSSDLCTRSSFSLRNRISCLIVPSLTLFLVSADSIWSCRSPWSESISALLAVSNRCINQPFFAFLEVAIFFILVSSWFLALLSTVIFSFDSFMDLSKMYLVCTVCNS